MFKSESNRGANYFVSSNILSLVKAYVFYDRVIPFAVYNDDIMVGFMMLRREDNDYFIWQFMINERYQSMGFGKQAMRKVIEWMKRDEGCSKIFLLSHFYDTANIFVLGKGLSRIPK